MKYNVRIYKKDGTYVSELMIDSTESRVDGRPIESSSDVHDYVNKYILYDNPGYYSVVEKKRR